MIAWYAFYTKPHCEVHASQALADRGLITYLPLAPSSDGARPAPVFPRYLFACCDLSTREGAELRCMTGLCEIVAFDGRPTAVPEEAIALMRAQSQMSRPLSPEAGALTHPLLAALYGPALPDAATQAMAHFLAELALSAARPAEQPIQPQLKWRVPRGTRGHGRRIHYPTP